MRRMAGGIIAVFVAVVLFFTGQETVSAQTLTDELIGKLDMQELDNYLGENEETEDISFGGLIRELISGDGRPLLSRLAEGMSQALFAEWRENKALLLMIVALAAGFTLLKNFSTIFRNSYISEMCFLLVYIELMVLLMKSFLIMNELLSETLQRVVEFMKMLIPVFAMSMVFSNGTGSAAGFYEMTFFIIYLVQWGLLYLLAPMVQIYVVMQFLNYILEGEKFTRMCELLEDGIRFCLKFIVTLVMGINLVQGLIYPAIDRLKTGTWAKAVGMIPGIGNSANAIGEMLIGTGMVIKNSVGAAAMLVLVVLTAIPLVKLYTMSFLYKLSAAVLEPVTDKRIAGSINGVFKGSVLAGKLMLTSLFLFFITIAMITASTSALAG